MGAARGPAVAGALQRPGQGLQGTFGIPLPLTGWRAYFWDPHSWPTGERVSPEGPACSALGFSRPEVPEFRSAGSEGSSSHPGSCALHGGRHP